MIPKIPTKMTIGVYFYIDEETNEIVFDVDSMREEFEHKLRILEMKK